MICEKPDAARRVASALSDGTSKSALVEGTSVYSFTLNGEEFVVCAAQGHVYGISDPIDERTVYPVFDVEWYPSNLVDDDSVGAGRRVSAIKKLSSGATRLVNACDFDAEGETIGHNLLRYACGGREADSLRAKFSTLTEEDLKRAFDSLEPEPNQGLARAGRARHSIDFVWGVNMSRALSQAVLGSGIRYRTVSIGRVQGPTLRFLADREREIREFVPTPYWKISGVFDVNGKKVAAAYAQEKIRTSAAAKRIREDCLGEGAVVASVKRRMVQVGPPPPFDIGELQKEVYRIFGISPSRTLQIAERLYLGALISYPRTGSQKLPPSLNLRGIVAGISKFQEYSRIADEILRSGAKPVQGPKSDPAHPAIHPTGEKPRHPLGRFESSIFDLVVRRFLAAFGASARRELVDVTIMVGSHKFVASGGRTVFQGWMDHYGRYAGYRDKEILQISEGDRLLTSSVDAEEKFELKPNRYNPGSLLEKMEREEIGTKATRADIIATLVDRGYVSGENMEVSELGFVVIDVMERFAPTIVGTGLTRKIEEKLEVVEDAGSGEAMILRETIRTIADQLSVLGAEEDALGKEIGSALEMTTAKQFVLGRCPVCKSGELRLITSRATGKRFAGCSNYPSACRASSPLPQKGTIKVLKACDDCSWPVISVTGRGRPWRLCINQDCPGRKK
ncbi:MAG: DNA topoisomerase I [Nitrososphaerota archaeon]|nr:DNA topoisomerase I [Nitrososphaerota archaeon]